MSQTQDVAIIGAGIVGLAHAWCAAEQGHRVTLFERNALARGASVRNFGMIWPIGQPAGELHEIALRSRDRWLKLAAESDIWANQCGSIHMAHRDDERAVLLEFHEQSSQFGFESDWLESSAVVQRSPAANPDGLQGGLFSPTELCVNPRKTIARMPGWLAEQHRVQCEFQTTITRVDDGRLAASDGRRWDVDRVVVCAGADFATLFPELLRESGMVRCKLQMLKTPRQADSWKLGPHLASGLTLRHYRNFESCPSLPALKQRIARETPELDQYGIHVMVSQNDAGELILGDSHEYDSDITPFDQSLIDDLMLRELRKIIRLPDWSIAERWHGVYSKDPARGWFQAQPTPKVHICTGLGGSGMTMSFGVAEQFWLGSY